jgi:hypothetical protein
LLPALGLLLLTPVVLCVVYVQREMLLARLRVGRWVDEPDSPESLRRWLIERPQLTMPLLTGRFADLETQHAQRAGEVVAAMLDSAEYLEPELVQSSFAAAASLHREYPRLPTPGRRQALALAYRLLERHLGRWSPHVPTVLDSAGQVLLASLYDEDATLKREALETLPRAWAWDAVDSSSASLVHEWLAELYNQAAKQLDSVDPRVRAAAVRALSSAPFHEWDDRLIVMLADDDPQVRKATLQSLAEFEDERLSGGERRRQAAKFLNDRDPEMARAAERILARAGWSSGRIDLIRRMQSADAAVRASACALAVDLQRAAEPGHDATAVLLYLSRDDDASVRLAFVAAAKRAGFASFADRLARLARHDPDATVRRAAAD